MNNASIENWLDKFKKAWGGKDLSGIEKLFSAGVEYWETPFKKLTGSEEVMKEWQPILNQEDINVNTTILSTDKNRSTIKWDLSYSQYGTRRHWAGLYFVELNNEQKCKYFVQVGEEEK